MPLRRYLVKSIPYTIIEKNWIAIPKISFQNKSIYNKRKMLDCHSEDIFSKAIHIRGLVKNN